MNITELKELAEKATPGPWKHRNGRIFQLDYEALTIANVARAFDGDYSPANGELLAAANPAAILELIAKLEDAQGEIRALRATESGLLDRLAQVEAEHVALLKAIMDAEPVGWIRPSGKAMLEAGGYCTVYLSGGMSNHSSPLYTLNGIKKP